MLKHSQAVKKKKKKENRKLLGIQLIRVNEPRLYWSYYWRAGCMFFFSFSENILGNILVKYFPSGPSGRFLSYIWSTGICNVIHFNVFNGDPGLLPMLTYSKHAILLGVYDKMIWYLSTIFYSLLYFCPHPFTDFSCYWDQSAIRYHLK